VLALSDTQIFGVNQDVPLKTVYYWTTVIISWPDYDAWTFIAESWWENNLSL